MKKNILSAIVFAALSFSAFAQSPEAFKYQAVVRNTSQTVIPNQVVGMQLSVLQGSTTGNIVYQETFSPTSNAYGLVNLEIGTGTIVSGTFVAIDWSAGPYFIETAMDATGGTNYVVMGTSQLLSVPYALYSKTAQNVTNDMVNDADSVIGNEYNTTVALNGTNLETTDGGGTIITDLSSLVVPDTLWGATGNNVYNLNTGNIGIGTNNPLSLLDVNGRAHIYTERVDGRDSVLLQGGYIMWNKVYGNGNTDFINQKGLGSVGGFRFAESNTSDIQTELMVIQGNGNVGIGIVAPTEKLEVNGNIKLSGSIIQEAWQNATLVNNWTNFGSGYATAQYYKDKEGIIHIKGVVQGGGLNLAATAIFNLPAGYRPSENRIMTGGSDAAGQGTSVRIDVNPNGDVTLVNALNNAGAYVSIEFSFRP